MITQGVRIPIESFKKIEIPPEDEVKGHYIIVTNVKEIAHEFDKWRMPELRDLDVTDAGSQRIRATLLDEPSAFWHRNRGILLLAHRVTFNKYTGTASIEFADPAMHGLVDGGHTYQIICNVMDGLKEEAKRNYKAYVRIEIFEGITDMDFIQELYYARNFSSMRLAN